MSRSRNPAPAISGSRAVDDLSIENIDLIPAGPLAGSPRFPLFEPAQPAARKSFSSPLRSPTIQYVQGKWRFILGKKFASVLAPVALAVFLILVDGCGAYNPGGTGGGTGGNSPGAAQGLYDCNLQQGSPAMEALILPTDVFYGVLGTLLPSSFTPTALVTGQGASKTTSYTGNLTEYLPSGSMSSSTVTATDVPNESISGTITETGGVQVGFGGAFLPAAFYTYSAPASIATVANVWTGALLDGSAVTLSISNTGSIMTTSAGCQITGNFTTFSNNTINVFNVTNLTFGNGCTTKQTASSAVAIVFLLPDGATHELLITATFSSTSATLFSGQH
jgi:hypothetical protein